MTRSELISHINSNKYRSAYPHITVRFIDGNEDVKATVAYGRWLGWNEQVMETAKADVTRYPVGQVVTVYHPADNPRKVVLERHSWLETIFLLPMGLLLLAVPVRYLLKGSQGKEQKQAPAVR